MEQEFQLKECGKLSLFEQNMMTSEDRGWWMRRLEKEAKARQDQEKKQSRSIPKPRMPSIRRR